MSNWAAGGPYHLRAVGVLNRLLSWLPLAIFAVFVAEATWMRWSLGRWPIVYRDDVAGFGAVLDAASEVGVLAFVYGFPAWLASSGVLWLTGHRSLATRRAILYVASLGILVTTVALDPVGFAEWWLD